MHIFTKWILIGILQWVIIFALFFVGRAFCQHVPPPRAVIHHSATPPTTTIQSIKDYHVNTRKWRDIGYHWIIKADGQIVQGRTGEGAHARGRNHLTGICLIGNDNFSPEQINSLTKLLKRLGITQIEPHHEQCPGHGINLQQIKEKL